MLVLDPMLSHSGSVFREHLPEGSPSARYVLFSLIADQSAIGVTLTENFAMLPGASVSGWYFGRPESRYFGLGRIGRDQVEDYAGRRGISIADAERWLSPNLAYDPD